MMLADIRVIEPKNKKDYAKLDRFAVVKVEKTIGDGSAPIVAYCQKYEAEKEIKLLALISKYEFVDDIWDIVDRVIEITEEHAEAHLNATQNVEES